MFIGSCNQDSAADCGDEGSSRDAPPSGEFATTKLKRVLSSMMILSFSFPLIGACVGIFPDVGGLEILFGGLVVGSEEIGERVGGGVCETGRGLGGSDGDVKGGKTGIVVVDSLPLPTVEVRSLERVFDDLPAIFEVLADFMNVFFALLSLSFEFVASMPARARPLTTAAPPR